MPEDQFLVFHLKQWATHHSHALIKCKLLCQHSKISPSLNNFAFFLFNKFDIRLLDYSILLKTIHVFKCTFICFFLNIHLGYPLIFFCLSASRGHTSAWQRLSGFIRPALYLQATMAGCLIRLYLYKFFLTFFYTFKMPKVSFFDFGPILTK